MHVLFQSPDGDFVYSDTQHGDLSYNGGHLFQSPDGDFVYSDMSTSRSQAGSGTSFNPLTGISSILTGL